LLILLNINFLSPLKKQKVQQ